MSNSTQTFTTGRWVKRLGLAGVVFFFIKGMLWLIIPTILYLYSK